MTREELKVHCEKQIEMCEVWAKRNGEEPGGKIYEEHKLILELLEQELCEDAIRREDAINAVSEALEHVVVENEDVARKMMNKLPSVNPQPKTGHWIDQGIYADGQNYHAFMCSECEWHYIGNKSELVDFKYCPFCRAKMQEAAEGSDKE